MNIILIQYLNELLKVDPYDPSASFHYLYSAKTYCHVYYFISCILLQFTVIKIINDTKLFSN